MEFLTVTLTVFVIIGGFGFLIFVHELGHFLAARWAGIRTESFAIGMGWPILSWRKGMGFRFMKLSWRKAPGRGLLAALCPRIQWGSTLPDYERRCTAHLAERELMPRDTDGGERKITLEQLYRAGDALGLGETEYSLRLLPLGGFVKMLGQEDANPNYVSNDPRSYNRTPIGKRMIVVSAGVIMNVILAAILFIITFMVGVQFPAPVVGSVNPTMPGGSTKAENADALGVDRIGILPGDRILTIDGEPTEAFSDVRIASAMGRLDQSVRLTVEREGLDEPLIFNLTPERNTTDNMLGFGIAQSRSTTLFGAGSKSDAETVQNTLERLGLATAGVEPGMTLIEAKIIDAAHWRTTSSPGELGTIIAGSRGAPLITRWAMLDDDGERVGDTVEATMDVEPVFERLIRRVKVDEDEKVYEYDFGLLGLSPLVRIASVIEDSPNRGILIEGDIILRVGSVDFPRRTQFMAEIADHAGDDLPMVVLREGERVEVTCSVSRKGKVGVLLGQALDEPYTASPVNSVFVQQAGEDDRVEKPTPIAPYGVLGGTRILSIEGVATEDWAAIRAALIDATRAAHEIGEGASVAVTIEHPTPGKEQAAIDCAMSADNVAALHSLGWTTRLAVVQFQPMYVTLSADGNPVKAFTMGVDRTHKMIVMVYLTIDRLFRGTVGVEQLRGPVGIVHMGVQIADQGAMYVIFLLAAISANLAVINFLPLPIVDGGLFLFLIYEKLKGKQPPIAFQNAATIIGLFLIGTIFIITFYNDIARLVTGS